MPLSREQKHDLLVRARNEISKGWCKHTLEHVGSRGRQVCAVGALNFALTGDAQHPTPDWMYYNVVDMREAVKKFLPEGFTCIVSFNNSPDTTQEMVLEVFDKAIAATAPEPNTPLEPPYDLIVNGPHPPASADEVETDRELVTA